VAQRFGEFMLRDLFVARVASGCETFSNILARICFMKYLSE